MVKTNKFELLNRSSLWLPTVIKGIFFTAWPHQGHLQNANIGKWRQIKNMNFPIFYLLFVIDLYDVYPQVWVLQNCKTIKSVIKWISPAKSHQNAGWSQILSQNMAMIATNIQGLKLSQICWNNCKYMPSLGNSKLWLCEIQSIPCSQHTQITIFVYLRPLGFGYIHS